ncbi:MAG TPA: 50S ribosomal protein L18 [Spirochaetota bacterium]|nr:50S ribosomal protein L18 [Spirochaetota bacterium]HPP03266.1 50S ribosomal protein L18 [Spirochaetota bacterium]
MFKRDWIKERRIRRKLSIRKKIKGTADKPRLSVYRSNRYIYVQAIDDEKGVTLASASSLSLDKNLKLNKETAKKIGEAIADKLLSLNIKNAVFDRNGFLYTGKIQSLVEAARKKGLKI